MSADHRQIEREAAAWLARLDGRGLGERRRAALDAWLAANPAHRVAFLRLEATWDESARLQTLSAGRRSDTIPARGDWANPPYLTPHYSGDRRIDPMPRPVRHRHPRRWRALAAIAAGFLVVAALAGTLVWNDVRHVDRGTWHTALGGRQVVHLADGSTATLASDTALEAVFSWNRRELHLLHGEAFFDVAHDPARPFVVLAGDYRVIAVGTRFDVRRGQAGLRVVVTRGLVRLQPRDGKKGAAAQLPAGSVALAGNGQVSVRQVSPEQAREFASWREGYVVFHGTPLADAAREFNRYNAGKILIADPSLDRLRVGGNFRLDNSGAFVRLIQRIFPVRVQPHGNDLVLSRRDSRHDR